MLSHNVYYAFERHAEELNDEQPFEQLGSFGPINNESTGVRKRTPRHKPMQSLADERE